MRRRTLLALGPIVLLTAAGCSAKEKAAPPAEAFATARTRFEEADALKLDLKSSPIPKGRDGVTSAVGTGVVDETSPKFSGQVTGVIQGTPAGVEIIAIAEDTWMSFFSKDYSPVKMSDLGAPNPALFFRPGTGLGKVLADTTEGAAGDQERQGKVVLQTYTGKVPASTVADLFVLGKDADSFDVTYGIEPESGQLRRAVISGEFYAGSTSTYTLLLTDYGTTVDIQPPS